MTFDRNAKSLQMYTVRTFASLVVAVSLLGCSGRESRAGGSHSNLDGILAPDNFHLRQEALETSLREQGFCDDLSLALDFLTEASMSQIGKAPSILANGLVSRCARGKRIDAARDLAEIFDEMGDGHSGLRFENALDVAVTGIVLSCVGDDSVCTELNGIGLHPIWNDADAPIIIGSNGTFNTLFRVKSLSGTTWSKTFSKEIFPSKKFGWNDSTSGFAVLRRSLQRSLLDKQPELANIPLELETVAEPRKKINVEIGWQHTLRDPRFALQRTLSKGLRDTSFGCLKDSMVGTSEIGACLGADGRSYLWIRNFLQREVFDKVLTSLSALMNQNGTLVVDLRGNEGGDMKLALGLACALSDENVITAMRDQAILVREILDEGSPLVVKKNSLSFRSNEDLVGRLFDHAKGREQTKLAFLERHGLTPDSCRAQRIATAPSTHMIFLTSGFEFSSAESFLQLARKHQHAIIVGRKTAGGSGFPTLVTFPGTGLRVAASLGRQVKISTGKVLIEGEGIQPDIVHEWAPTFARESFEAQSSCFAPCLESLTNTPTQDLEFAITSAVNGKKF